ncbi:MAG TPA: LysR substrate-binding domain-containing protein [Verrucomicrobiae bacterium]|jgi:DNA-binding transcriptional LysR family regulator
MGGKKPKFSRKIKILLWAAGLLLAYTMAGFLLVPAIIKSQMLKRLPVVAKRQAAVSQVAFNPFTFALAVRGLSLRETNGGDFAGLDGFHVQFQALSSMHRRAWVFQDVTVAHPFVHVIRRRDGTFNFDNLADTNSAPAPKPAAPSALPALVIESLRIDGASLQADDLSLAQAFHDKVAPVNLQLTNLAIMLHVGAPFVFSATTDANEKFTVSGNITVQPFTVAGSVTVAALDLTQYGPYLAPFTTAELAGGKLDAGADYQAGASTTACQLLNPPVLREFKESFPDHAISIEPGDTPELVEALLSHQIDLALSLEVQREPRIKFHPLFSDELMFIVAPLHPWARSGRIERAAIARQNYILYSKRSITCRLITEHFRREQMELNTVIEAGSMEATKELVKLGLGVSILAPWITHKEIEDGSLVALPPGRHKLQRNWGLLQWQGKQLNLAEETFIGLCESFCSPLRLSGKLN